MNASINKIRTLAQIIVSTGGIVDGHSSNKQRVIIKGAIAILKTSPDGDTSGEVGKVVVLLENCCHSLNGLNIVNGEAVLSTYAVNIMDIPCSFEDYIEVFNKEVGPKCFYKETRLENMITFELIDGAIVLKEMFNETEDAGKMASNVPAVFPFNTKCQLGNEIDTHGYEPSADVTIIAEQDRMCGKVYLIDTGKCYGIALEDKESKVGLSCTCAMPYRYSADVTSRTLGFNPEFFTKSA